MCGEDIPLDDRFGISRLQSAVVVLVRDVLMAAMGGLRSTCTVQLLEWCHRIALATAEELPEAVAPLRTPSGDTVVRVAGHPISVWPFVGGSWVDKAGDRQREQAAELLARLHRALAPRRFGDRPSGAGTVTTQPVGDHDPDLDRWVRRFDAGAASTQAIHGDFYAGNMLARDGRIVALLDWDEALLCPPTRELAWAAWEFGDGLWADDLDQVWAFITAYQDASGPAERPDDVTLRMLVRQRLLGEMRYIDQQSSSSELTDEDRAHRRRQESVYDLRGSGVTRRRR